MAAKRGYSSAFPFRESGKRYLLDGIPASLWTRVRSKARREGLSIRTLILTLLTHWLNTPERAD